ncbi:hypothetical protein MTO96_004472 [Rhipicephalus appendiculatus]
MRRVEAYQLCQPSTVCSVLNDTKLQVGGVLLPELLVLFSRNALHHVQGLAHKFLLDYLEQFVLLQRFTAHIQRQVIRVNHTTDETKVTRHHVLEIIGDEHTPNIELDVIYLPSISVEGLCWLHCRYVEQRLKCQLSLCYEMGLS